MNRDEAIEILKQNKAAAEFYTGITQISQRVENELKDIEAFDMAIEALSTEAEWIPVSKALPSKGQVVLAIGDKGTWDVGQFKGTAEWTDDERMWWWKNKSIKRVECWMPKDAIPLPYREDGEE